MEQFTIPKELLDRIGSFLITLPFKDVFQLLQDLNAQVKPVAPVPPADQAAP